MSRVSDIVVLAGGTVNGKGPQGRAVVAYKRDKGSYEAGSVWEGS